MNNGHKKIILPTGIHLVKPLEPEAKTGEEDEFEYPRIRPITAIPVEIGEMTMVLIQDQAGISEKTAVITPETLYLISMFDGNHSLLDIQTSFNQAFGQLLFTEKIRDIIFELDAALLMDSRKFRQYMEFLEEDFRKSRVRESAHAGVSYPEDPKELRELIDSFFKKLPPDFTSLAPLGIAAPHIDFFRGESTYAHAYRQLQKSETDLFVIFATSHQPIDNLVALTSKKFTTALGDLECHEEFIKDLAANCPLDLFAGEYRHKTEHTIEFQALMLKYIFPDRDIRIVPILVSSLDELGEKNRKPMDDPRVKAFLKAFDKTVTEKGYNPAYIAGVDFAHVGQSFGDRRPPTPKEYLDLEDRDRASIHFLEQADPEGFFSDVVKTQETRRICGLAPLYMMIKAMKPTRGQLLDYRRHTDEAETTTVTFAAMGFYDS